MSAPAPNLSIRARPRAVRRLSRKALMGGAFILSAVMFAALATALKSPAREADQSQELYNVTHKPMASGLELLPKSYAEMKPVLGPPLPGDLGEAYLSKRTTGAPEVVKTSSITEPTIAIQEPPQPVRRVATAPKVYAEETLRPQVSGLFFEAGRKRENSHFSPSANKFSQLRNAEIGSPFPDYSAYADPASLFEGVDHQTDFNKQSDKQSFLEQETDGIYNSHGLVSPRSPYQVMAGSLIPASLITGLNSDLPGQVIGQVSENVYDTVTGQHLLIPQGARLMGRYDSVIAFGQSRALVVWTRLILPNGDSIQLDNLPASDSQGFAGLKDKVDRHTWQFIKGAALSSLLSVGSELASDDGDRLTRALQNAGQDTANITGQRIIDRNLKVQPTLKVRQGWRFNVIVSRDLILKPYGDSQ